MRGRFITLEGGEGVGKTTLMAALAERLEATGRAVVRTREPGGTPLAEAVRGLALHPPEGARWTPLSEALLMNAARADHIKGLIAPALADGSWVISDRFADSTRAYQSASGGVAMADLRALENMVVGDMRPDLTLVLDAPPEALLGRREARGVSDAFEQRDRDFHTAVRLAFLAIAKDEPERCAVIDAAATPDEAAAAAWGVMSERLPELCSRRR